MTGNATNYKNSQGDNSICSTRQGRRQRGGQWCPAPPFHVWPPCCCIHPTLYFKNVVPLLFFCPSIWFLASLLLNLGDGPATRDEISQPSQPISPRAATDCDFFQLIRFSNTAAFFSSLLGLVSHSFREGDSSEEISTQWLCLKEINHSRVSWLVSISLQAGLSCL